MFQQSSLPPVIDGLSAGCFWVWKTPALSQQSVIMIKAQVIQLGGSGSSSSVLALSFVVLSVLFSPWQALQAVTQEASGSHGDRARYQTRACDRGSLRDLLICEKRCTSSPELPSDHYWSLSDDEQLYAASLCALGVFYPFFPHTLIFILLIQHIFILSLTSSHWPSSFLLSLKNLQMIDPTLCI